MARFLVSFLILSAAALGLVPMAVAQDACGDSLALRSPESLEVVFDRNEFRQGNRLIWPDVPPQESACFRVEVSDEIQQKFDPQIEGEYIDIFDRLLIFAIEGNGLVGDTTEDRLQLFIAGNHPNSAIPPLNGSMNLSNRGGAFRLNLQTGLAVQSNGQGATRIPAHLSSTDVTALEAWTDGTNSRVYAAVSGLPLAVSTDGGVNWSEASTDEVDPIGFPILSLAVAPSNPDIIFAGTDKKGLWISVDGGQAYARADGDLQQTDQGVTSLTYLSVDTGGGSMVDRLFVGLSGIGFFYSDDNGATFQPADLVIPTDLLGTEQVPNCLDVLDPSINPRVLSVVRSPSDPSRLYLGLETFGVYRSDDGGTSWMRANDGLVKCETGNEQDPPRPVNGDLVFVFDQQAGGDDVLLVSTQFNGTFVSTSSGDFWAGPVTGLPEDEELAQYEITGFVQNPSNPSSAYAVTDGGGIVITADLGTTWCVVGENGCGVETGIFTDRLGSVVFDPADPNILIVGTLGGGVYKPGLAVPVRRILDPRLVPAAYVDPNLNLGLTVALNAGTVNTDDSFRVAAQTFQGYAVWRATEFRDAPTLAEREPLWQLIGLYDRTNPEFCFEDNCGAPNPQSIPECFADKRSNCFTFRSDGMVEFFDREIYNGFTYQYAVSSFDYGFAGNISPRGFDGDMVYSPRSALETSDQSPYDPVGNNNRVEFQVNVAAQGNFDDVIVVPNPLRRQGGWDIGDESTVRFVNVTRDANCEVFTLAGDLVAELDNAATGGEQRGNIQWDTRNQNGELVASGVYLFRITSPSGGEKIGRFTIIR